MAIKRKDFQKVSSTVQEFLLKLPDEEASARLRDNLLQALHFLQLYYRLLQNRDKNTDPTQWTIDHSLSPLTPFREAPDKFDWEWTSVENPPKALRNSLSRSTSESLRNLAPVLNFIKNGDLQQVRDEIESNEDLVYAQDALNRDCIHYAVQYEQFEVLKYLLKRNPNLNNPALDGSISLHRAVYKGNAHMVKLLLDYGAPVNAQDFYSRTPVHWSIIHENTDCLRILLDYSVDLHLKDQDGMSAAMWACHLDRFEHLRLINKVSPQQLKYDIDNEGKSCIHWSVRKKEPLECLKALLNLETIYLVDKDGKTCLHTAAEQGALEACKIIIDFSNNKDIVNIRDSRKQTPLHVSSLNGHARVIKLLIELGADPHSKDATGATPIDYIVKRNLLFCNSIVDLCLRRDDKKMSKDNNSTNANNDMNLTPAPPTTPKSVFSRNSFFYSPIQSTNSLPPKPLSRNSSMAKSKTYEEDNEENPVIRRSSNSRNGHNRIVDRIPSASIKHSRTSSRSSFASEDLEKYMSHTSHNETKPMPHPRVVSNASTNRILSSRPHDNENIPPPIKPRVASLSNNSFNKIDSYEQNPFQNQHTNSIHVEDVSEDETKSVTSTKGEGFGSDFSDSELRRTRESNPKKVKLTNQDYNRRPSTPMEIRTDQIIHQVPGSILKKRQLSGGNQKTQQQSSELPKPTRFNEWEPHRDRQKSPSKVHIKDSSPRQTSGRNGIGSASDRSTHELDLMVSGKNIGRKDSSPVNTPREVAPLRPPTRRLQPLDTNITGNEQHQQHEFGLNSPKQRAEHILKSKHIKSSSILDRKKLEPIKVPMMPQNATNRNQFDQDVDFQASQNQFDDEPTQSISENTVSSERQNSMRITTRNKIPAQNRSHFGMKKRLVEPMVNGNED